MTNPADALAPCPFCGAPGTLHENDWCEPEEWNVFCTSATCLASTSSADDKAVAIAAWNRRPAPPAPAGEREYPADLSPRSLLVQLVDGDLSPGQKIDAILRRDRALAALGSSPAPAGERERLAIWLDELAAKGGKGRVNNIDARSLARIAALLRAPAGDGWRVPDGWRLVPVAPTEEMVQAYLDAQRKYGPNRAGYFFPAWAAMLHAAPSPEQQPAEATDKKKSRYAYNPGGYDDATADVLFKK